MKKILICEDDKDILEVCELILKSHDYEVEKSTSITNVYELVEKTHPDLILMDLWIPDIGGEEATNLLKHSSKYKDIPVILFSANNDIEDIAHKCAADGFLKKPFDINQLEKVVQQHCSAA